MRPIFTFFGLLLLWVGNTAVGSGALQQTTNSGYNTAIGYNVGLSMILSWVTAFLT
jgi:hypothetical protein